MPAWSLILFTLVVQACVGATVWIEVLQLPAAGRKRMDLPDTVRSTTMLGITFGTAVAALISIFHLGSPIKAVLAVNNLRTSWLSREILLVILFGGGVALATMMRRRAWGSETSRILAGRSSAVLGLALVYAMARVYMLPTTPSWNTAATAISFFSTSLVLGGTVALAGLVYSARTSSPSDTVRMVVWVLMICLCVEIALTSFQAGILYQHPMVVDHGDSFTMLNTLLGMRVLSVVFALGFLIKLRSASVQWPRRWILTTMALVVFAEVVGRYVFYAFYYRIGV